MSNIGFNPYDSEQRKFLKDIGTLEIEKISSKKNQIIIDKNVNATGLNVTASSGTFNTITNCGTVISPIGPNDRAGGQLGMGWDVILYRNQHFGNTIMSVGKDSVFNGQGAVGGGGSQFIWEASPSSYMPFDGIYAQFRNKGTKAAFSSTSSSSVLTLLDCGIGQYSDGLRLTSNTTNTFLNSNLNMGGFKVSNLATPTASSDAATKAYVDEGRLSGTAAPVSTPTKVGLIYVDTVAKKVYVSTGTTNASDWTIVSKYYTIIFFIY